MSGLNPSLVIVTTLHLSPLATSQQVSSALALGESTAEMLQSSPTYPVAQRHVWLRQTPVREN